MRPSTLCSMSKSFTPTKCHRRQLGVLAHQLETATRPRPEPIPTQHEPLKPRQRPDPHVLVASELTHIRQNMLNLLGSAHPGLADLAGYYLLHPSKQLRSLLVLLFSRATNGHGRHWDRKQWDAAYESSSGQSEAFDRPLKLPNVLYEWNSSMPDHTDSFQSVFLLQRQVPTSAPPPPFPLTLNIAPRPISPPLFLPTQLRLAQIVEMIHAASLLHGTITNDPGGEKDGFGNKISILGGDFLLGRASTALSRLGESEVVELVASVISNLVEGEFLLMEEIKVPELCLTQGPTALQNAWELYLRKTYLRTASLMAKGARSAVILGGSHEGDIWKEVAYAYGRNLGIAYQLFEDAASLEDIQPGSVCGPALFACEECPSLLPLIQRNFSLPGDVELAIEYIRGTSGVERTRLLAIAYAEKAGEMLHMLPDSDAKLALETLIDVVAKR